MIPSQSVPILIFKLYQNLQYNNGYQAVWKTSNPCQRYHKIPFFFLLSEFSLNNVFLCNRVQYKKYQKCETGEYLCTLIHSKLSFCYVQSEILWIRLCPLETKLMSIQICTKVRVALSDICSFFPPSLRLMILITLSNDRSTHVDIHSSVKLDVSIL